jgi:dihydroneopterin aldolase
MIHAKSLALIELRGLELKVHIGTKTPEDIKSDIHLLDLTLGVALGQVLILEDGMEHVFDYDPLIVEIEKLSSDGTYDTQERLATRIAHLCASQRGVRTIEICLKNYLKRGAGSSVGIRLRLDETDTAKLLA